jgi:hypothetical protein
MLLQDTICATTSSVLTISFVQIILIGDHHQLPPVVKNQAFQKYSHLDQPLFTRFIRLGVPYHELTAQGRCRPSIAKLYNWRYRALGDLPHVRTLPRFRTPNAGFAYDFQFVDVRPCRGPGESTPSPHFYQNVDEAEFVVRVYMYMRLIGYPAERITLLTTYNGQKALLEDIVRRHCTSNALFGAPAKIATVDKYQGQQNDYVLLSLVRTRSVGHLRDVRRLVVAMSRARLGVYIFGCRTLFEQCYELAPTFQQLLERPSELALLLGERWEAQFIGQRGFGRGGEAVSAVDGGVVVTSLPQMEGVVQGVADRIASEALQAAAAAPDSFAAAVAAQPTRKGAVGGDEGAAGSSEFAATDVEGEAAEGTAADGAAQTDVAMVSQPPGGAERPRPRPPAGPPPTMPPLAPPPIWNTQGIAHGPAFGMIPGRPAPGMPPPGIMSPSWMPHNWGAFTMPQFVVNTPVKALPGEVQVGQPLKHKKRPGLGVMKDKAGVKHVTRNNPKKGKKVPDQGNSSHLERGSGQEVGGPGEGVVDAEGCTVPAPRPDAGTENGAAEGMATSGQAGNALLAVLVETAGVAGGCLSGSSTAPAEAASAMATSNATAEAVAVASKVPVEAVVAASQMAASEAGGGAGAAAGKGCAPAEAAIALNAASKAGRKKLE